MEIRACTLSDRSQSESGRSDILGTKGGSRPKGDVPADEIIDLDVTARYLLEIPMKTRGNRRVLVGADRNVIAVVR